MSLPRGVRDQEVIVSPGQERQHRFLHFLCWNGRLGLGRHPGPPGRQLREASRDSHNKLRGPVGVALPASAATNGSPGCIKSVFSCPEGLIVGVSHHEGHAGMRSNAGCHVSGPLYQGAGASESGPAR